MITLSYNLRKNRALNEVGALVEAHEVDVLCLQEADVFQLPDRFEGLRLVRATEQNRLGLALYARESRFSVHTANAFRLKKSLHDHVLSPAHERLLGARLTDHDHDMDIVVASFHAAPLTALNSLRRHQINSALWELQELGPGLPSLMVGDYNYPVFQEKLDQHMRARGYELTLSDARTYQRYGVFRGHYDFATSTGFDMHQVKTLSQGTSDHLPVLVNATVKDRAFVPADV